MAMLRCPPERCQWALSRCICADIARCKYQGEKGRKKALLRIAGVLQKMSGLGIVGKSQNPYLAMMDFSCFPISAIAACCAGSFSVKRVPVAESRTSIEVSSEFSDSRM